MKGTCTFCEQPVKRHQIAAWSVEGWEIEREGGGANQIKGRRRTGHVAHATCLERQLRFGGDQQTLMPEDP